MSRFDIEKHEFADCSLYKGRLNLNYTLDFLEIVIHEDIEEGDVVRLTKLDAIAIAKALGVTAEDLE